MFFFKALNKKSFSTASHLVISRQHISSINKSNSVTSSVVCLHYIAWVYTHEWGRGVLLLFVIGVFLTFKAVISNSASILEALQINALKVRKTPITKGNSTSLLYLCPLEFFSANLHTFRTPENKTVWNSLSSLSGEWSRHITSELHC